MATKKELQQRLARPNAGRKPLGEKARTVAEAAALNYRTRLIAEAWTLDGVPPDSWLDDMIAQVPADVRALRSDDDWRKLVRKRIEKRMKKEGL